MGGMDANARKRAGERPPALADLPDLGAEEAGHAMSGPDEVSLPGEQVPEALARSRTPVPVPSIGEGTGNRFPELAGTTGTAPPFFEPLAGFMARTRNLPPTRWLLEGVVREAGRLLIVAAPNAGKTWLGIVIAKAAAEQGRRVFMILEEGGARPTSDRFKSLAIPEDAPIEVAHCRGFLLGDDPRRRNLIERLRAEDAPVLILDPLVSMFRGDENDTREMNQVRAHLDELVQANPRALIVLLHHTSKAGERGEGNAVYAGRGSTVIGGWADVALNLRHEQSPKGEGRVIFSVLVAKNRDGERDYRVRFDLSLGGNGLVCFAPDEGARSVDLRHAIGEALRAATKPLSGNALVQQLKRRKKDVQDALREMEGEGGECQRSCRVKD